MKKVIRDNNRPIIEDIKKYIDENMFLAIKLDGYIKKAFTYINNQFPKLI